MLLKSHTVYHINALKISSLSFSIRNCCNRVHDVSGSRCTDAGISLQDTLMLEVCLAL